MIFQEDFKGGLKIGTGLDWKTKDRTELDWTEFDSNSINIENVAEKTLPDLEHSRGFLKEIRGRNRNKIPNFATKIIFGVIYCSQFIFPISVDLVNWEKL